MPEHQPVSVPPNPGTRIVADQQGLDEFVRFQARKPRRLCPKRQQPIRDRLGRGEAGIVKVVSPAVGGGQPLTEPSMELEGREFRRVDRRDQHLLLAGCDDGISLRQPREAGLTEQIRLGSDQGHYAGNRCRVRLCGKRDARSRLRFKASVVVASCSPFGLDANGGRRNKWTRWNSTQSPKRRTYRQISTRSLWCR